jgi:hypothetical protein
MIDPLDLHPSEPILPRRQVGEVFTEFEAPAPARSARPDQNTPASEGSPKPSTYPEKTALARTLRPTGKIGTFERAIGVAKTVLPLVGKILPLLEGNVVATASNLLANRQVQEINLKPLEEAIGSLQADQRALTFHTGEHKRILRKLEDDFASIQEAVQKNSETQAELMEQVAHLSKRTSLFMRLVVVLLVLSILFTALLCVRIAYIIRF